MAKGHIKYSEGQWFAVPLRDGGYALGIIVRGNYKTKGGLGYFFGPRYAKVPDAEKTFEKKPEEAVLIALFGDLGIISGRWPLVQSTRPFSVEDWPIPLFSAPIRLIPEKAYIREYQQDDSGVLRIARQEVVDLKDVVNLPSDKSMGGGSVETRLSELLIEI